MTALDQYDRLEALALWRAQAGGELREVIITFGNSRLTLMDMDEAPITQWSLAALRVSEEADPAGRSTAIGLSPDPDGAECLWFDDPDMKAAIEAVYVEEETPVEAPKSQGRRIFAYAILALSLVAIVLGIAFGRPWASQALVAQVPEEVWRSVADDIAAAQTDLAGLSICRRAGRPDPSLMRIQTRLGATEARIAPVLFTSTAAVSPVVTLPDGRVLLDAEVMRAASQPEALAGLMALGLARQDRDQARARIAGAIGLTDLLGLVTRGTLGQGALDTAAQTLLTLPHREDEADAEALRLLEAAGLPSSPLALILSNRDLPIERLELIAAADTIGSEPYTPALPDQEWLALRNRCAAR